MSHEQTIGNADHDAPPRFGDPEPLRYEFCAHCKRDMALLMESDGTASWYDGAYLYQDGDTLYGDSLLPEAYETGLRLFCCNDCEHEFERERPWWVEPICQVIAFVIGVAAISLFAWMVAAL